MSRTLDSSVLKKWVASVGGIKAATEIIKSKLECSMSKAQKIAGGRYRSLPAAAEQALLADLIGKPREKVFPVGAGKSQAS